jgi:hypothetical protein
MVELEDRSLPVGEMRATLEEAIEELNLSTGLSGRQR